MRYSTSQDISFHVYHPAKTLLLERHRFSKSKSTPRLQTILNQIFSCWKKIHPTLSFLNFLVLPQSLICWPMNYPIWHGAQIWDCFPIGNLLLSYIVLFSLKLWMFFRHTLKLWKSHRIFLRQDGEKIDKNFLYNKIIVNFPKDISTFNKLRCGRL